MQKCSRHDNCTDAGLIKWLLSKHIEETANYRICKNLKADDKILVSNTGNYWEKRHYAGYDSGSDSVLAFDSSTTSWTADKQCVAQWKYVKLPEKEGEQGNGRIYQCD